MVLGSFAVQFGDHCGRGSFAVSGSFAALYKSLVQFELF